MGTPKIQGKTHWRLGLQGHLGVMFAAFVLLTGLILAGIGYHVVVVANDLDIREKVDDLTQIIKSELVYNIRQPVLPALHALAQSPLPDCLTFEERLRFLPALISTLENYPILSGVMVGYEDGDFFMVRHLDVEQERQAYNAPPGADFLVSSITRTLDAARHEHFIRILMPASFFCAARPHGKKDTIPASAPGLQAPCNRARSQKKASLCFFPDCRSSFSPKKAPAARP